MRLKPFTFWVAPQLTSPVRQKRFGPRSGPQNAGRRVLRRRQQLLAKYLAERWGSLARIRLKAIIVSQYSTCYCTPRPWVCSSRRAFSLLQNGVWVPKQGASAAKKVHLYCTISSMCGHQLERRPELLRGRPLLVVLGRAKHFRRRYYSSESALPRLILRYLPAQTNDFL